MEVLLLAVGVPATFVAVPAALTATGAAIATSLSIGTLAVGSTFAAIGGLMAAPVVLTITVSTGAIITISLAGIGTFAIGTVAIPVLGSLVAAPIVLTMTVSTGAVIVAVGTAIAIFGSLIGIGVAISAGFGLYLASPAILAAAESIGAVKKPF